MYHSTRIFLCCVWISFLSVQGSAGLEEDIRKEREQKSLAGLSRPVERPSSAPSIFEEKKPSTGDYLKIKEFKDGIGNPLFPIPYNSIEDFIDQQNGGSSSSSGQDSLEGANLLKLHDRAVDMWENNFERDPAIYKQAFWILRVAAAQGHSLSERFLQKKRQNSEEWGHLIENLQLMAEGGSIEDCYLLGMLKMVCDKEQALSYFQHAIAKGEPGEEEYQGKPIAYEGAQNAYKDALISLAVMSFKAENPDFEKAFDYASTAANLGSAEAFYILFCIKREQYYLALEEKKPEDYVQEVLRELRGYLQEAAQRNYYLGYYELGLLYQQGDLFEKNIERAIDCFKKGMEFGNASCFLEYGLLCVEEEDPVKKREGFHYIEEAAALEHPKACLYIGNFYKKGIPGILRPNDAEAAFYYQRSFEFYKQEASQDNPESFFYIGEFYRIGIPYFLEPNDAEALLYYQDAFASGYMEAALLLGHFYAEGIGGEKDIGLAQWYYHRALDAGVLGAREAIEAFWDKNDDNT